MALVKISELDKTEIVGINKMVQCRHATYVQDDVTGEVIGGKNFTCYNVLNIYCVSALNVFKFTYNFCFV